ncbi:MAG: efflux RND transporter periplasmic adaptor subunit [Pseudomonadota bacterium]|nr:efflux RND transporter periplasmic adaptor subunit [Pseudomonadota bacterium]
MTKAKWGSMGLSIAVVVLALWMFTGEVKVASDEAPPEPKAQQQEPTRVEVERLDAKTYQPMLRLQGQLEPWQSVMISARQPGTVESIEVALGDRVQVGQTLLTLSTDGRDAEAERWRSSIRQLEADLAAAQRLRSSNLAAQNEILRLQSELAGARAELAAADLALSHLTPKAPFAGVINQRDVEQGSLVQVGTAMFEVVQVDRLKARGRIPQQAVSSVQPGQSVRVDLLDGSQLSGVVSFVASAANPETRTFAVEIIVDNPDEKRVAGGSATLNIRLPEQPAMFISPAYLSLNDDGRPGVKFVDAQDQVVFQTVKLLSVSTDGAWVSGLPDEIRLITRGAGFVAEGETVTPVDQSDQRG